MLPQTPSAPTRSLPARALCALAVIVVVRYSYIAAASLRDYQAVDFRENYHFYALYFRDHGNEAPTQERVGAFGRTIGVKTRLPPLHIPAFYFTLTPLTWLPSWAALAAAILLNQAAVALSLVLLIRAYGPPPSDVRALVVALAYLFGPMVMDVKQGQLNGIALLCLTSSWYLMERGRPVSAGLALVWALLYKVQLCLLLVVLLRIRRWRTLGGCALGAGILVGASLVFIDPARYMEWLHGLLTFGTGTPSPTVWRSFDMYAIYPFGSSLHQYFLRVFQPSEYTRPILDSAFAARAGTVASILVASLWFLRSARPASPLDLVWGGAILLTELVSPFTNSYHLVWVLFPVIAGCLHFWRSGATRREWALAFLAYVGTCQSYWIVWLTITRAAPGATLVQVIPQPEMVGLCVGLVLVLRRLGQARGAAGALLPGGSAA